MQMFLRICVLFLIIGLAPIASQAASLVAKVDVSQQTMVVYRYGEPIYRWKVSTARKGKWTPRGSWSAKWLSRDHKSSRYNDAPMPYAIFYSGHYAVHGTYQTSRLGRPASAGCVRLHPEHARKLYNLTRKHGLKNTRIVVKN